MGVYRLPAGYTRASFLESTGSCGFSIPLTSLSTITGRYCKNVSASGGKLLGAFRDIGNGEYWGLFADGTIYLGEVSSLGISGLIPFNSIIKMEADGVSLTVGAVTKKRNVTISLSESSGYETFGLGYNSQGAQIYNLSVSSAGEKQCNYIPAIDSAGVPCMWDTVTMTPKYNQGTDDFIVGLTAVQARKLGNLPDGGGTLTISLPSEVVDENGVLQDPAIFTALSQAAAKGWSFILQTHDGTAIGINVPQGYIECEFLENPQTAYIETGLEQTQYTGCRIVCTRPPSYRGTFLLLAGNEAFVPLMYYRVNETEVIGYTANGSKYPLKDGTTATSGANALNKGYAPAEKISVELNYCNSGKWIADNGGEIIERDVSFSPKPYEFYLFARNYYNQIPGDSYFYGWPAKIYTAIFTEGAEVTRNYIPAITPEGLPCMYEKVLGEAKLNVGTGAFICGMTAAQAVQLANLPTGGGELTVSLPQSILNDAGEITDAAVRAALNKAADNGWDITLQYYNEQ